MKGKPHLPTSHSRDFIYIHIGAEDVLDGYNGTVFAYGQTGSGKTFTMMVSLSSSARYLTDIVVIGSRYRLR